nr:hypothetical protein A5821_002716 [Enterococcus sp. 7F3_DIV0205]
MYNYICENITLFKFLYFYGVNIIKKRKARVV